MSANDFSTFILCLPLVNSKILISIYEERSNSRTHATFLKFSMTKNTYFFLGVIGLRVCSITNIVRSI